MYFSNLRSGLFGIEKIAVKQQEVIFLNHPIYFNRFKIVIKSIILNPV